MSGRYLIRLEDEQGNVLHEIIDDCGLIDDILLPLSVKRNGLLKYVDPYGTTTLNGLQAEALLSELEGVRGKIMSERHELKLAALKSLSQQCDDEPHLFLKIYGD